MAPEEETAAAVEINLNAFLHVCSFACSRAIESCENDATPGFPPVRWKGDLPLPALRLLLEATRPRFALHILPSILTSDVFGVGLDWPLLHGTARGVGEECVPLYIVGP
jgi:hypothetical protein